jgi:DNA repair exonuclease SbcCD nuclease subunit
MEEYAEQLTKFIEKCKEICEPYDKDEVRIVVTGDLLHHKNTLSPESIAFVSTFLRQLQEVAKVLVIAGNHDFIVNNVSRKDAISALFETACFDNCFLLDAELGYQSGYVIDDNIIWSVYSIFNDYVRPDIEQAKIDNPTHKVVGLYHGMMVGATLQNGYISEHGVSSDIFFGCDCVMAGDIHKFQEIKRNGISIVYSSSLIQQTFGETLNKHGFCVWDMENLTYDFVELETEYGLYDMEISSMEDLDEDKEVIKNLGNV